MTRMIENGTAVVGGNLVQLDNKNRIHVTNQKGKSKVLTHDQFKRQVMQNQDKLMNGENIEFKKETSPAKKIALILLGAGALIGGIAYRKKIVDFFKGIKTSESGTQVRQKVDDAVGTVKDALAKPEETAAIVTEKTREVISSTATKASELAGKATAKTLNGWNAITNFFKGFEKKAK